ncbi:MAG: carbamate kinase [Acidobacteria bacterium]|nr:MAG: carbamate kinase [Acidobacteriota bacterium]
MHRLEELHLGGNAITRPGEEGSVAQDYANLRRSLKGVVDLVERGYQVILTHGNGPQVGNQMIRVELARGQAPDLPLDVVVADLQGGLGYMIERVLRNHLLRRNLEVPVCVLVTQIEVDENDPALKRPAKFVGPVFSRREIEKLAAERGWQVKEDPGRGWRRVVPSPEPIAIVERDLIRTLVDAGALVIVSGGGGIPVARSRKRRMLKGVEAVIDKDLAAAVLAREVGASELYILTSVEHVMLDFGTPQARPLGTVTVAEARRYLAAGQFPPGSMGPKIEAACRFVENGGRRALITDIFALGRALAGRTGTWIVP